MCISLPARIVSIEGQIARVDQNGILREVLLAVPEASVGSFALIYGNAAIHLISESEARESARLITQLEDSARSQSQNKNGL